MYFYIIIQYFNLDSHRKMDNPVIHRGKKKGL